MLLLPFKIVSISLILWVFLTTIVPQATTKFNCIKLTNKYYPYDSISENSLNNSIIYYIISHPDDEVMFFSPSIIELSKPQYNNRLKLVCLSKGNSIEEMGPIRESELIKSAEILGFDVSDVSIFDFKDGMNESWSHVDIYKTLDSVVIDDSKDKVIITFDEFGVSNHPNHISTHFGVLKYCQQNNIKLFNLKSLNFLEKYSFTLLTNIELFINNCLKLVLSYLNFNINISFNNSSNSIKYYSDLNMLSLSYASMMFGHFSQMVWFRYGWLFLSRYLTYNNLIEVEI
ncbi:N-acetylglucosaminyl-phosphatidylinositol de-N-acetylase [[Candida] jaroonii]|uniref:N-acetylglucosaminyl-phosphatidylinositol de-N-acetylase n=1 Tax=[Candida] jaroonii TaxID=467808 RepID=A0ACA9Y1B4_9ASCO|nr:N-acetylglucosaminyl-phosphatidylinositol de-N-acetylase [[Candida] jaroonii]